MFYCSLFQSVFLCFSQLLWLDYRHAGYTAVESPVIGSGPSCCTAVDTDTLCNHPTEHCTPHLNEFCVSKTNWHPKEVGSLQRYVCYTRRTYHTYPLYHSVYLVQELDTPVQQYCSVCCADFQSRTTPQRGSIMYLPHMVRILLFFRFPMKCPVEKPGGCNQKIKKVARDPR